MGELSELQRIARLLESSRYEQAISACKSLLARSAADADALSLLGLSMTYAGQGRDGLACLEQAADSRPEEPRLRLHLALGLLLTGSNERAEAQCRSVLQLQPG